MPLAWNEIRHRAIQFANSWRGETREAAERQTFWNEFFNVFGINRRFVKVIYEEPVKLLSGNWGSIDIFWPGKLLGEHKSAGKDLGQAHTQALDYIRGLKESRREKEIPRWVMVTDFRHIALHDLEPEPESDSPLVQCLPPSVTFPLADLHRYIRHFAFIAGYTQHRLNPEDPVNEEAVQLMCRVHDELEAGGFTGHGLKRFLVRLLFCLFADDTGIFPPRAFEFYLEDHAFEDMTAVGLRLDHLFSVLNTPEAQRQQHLAPELADFPYVNGELFAERLPGADFSHDAREALRACCRFDWSRISPAVFGSLFQAVMDKKERRQIGAHYTAEKNILKLIRSLFLDELRAEFEKLKALKVGKAQRLREFQDKLARLRFFDPACGCGNFLVLTYRELRKLELEVLLELHGRQHEMTLDDANRLSKLNVHQLHGIEIEEFPARIAEVALWLTDHQADIALSLAFSQTVLRLPLRASPHIVVGNALRLDWTQVLPPAQCSYVLGNPPFVGKKEQTAEQKADMELIWKGVKGAGILDYVTAWYHKAGEYIHRTQIQVAFVSTNSVTQGEQVGVFWNEMFSRYRVKIHFAHTTFAWESEARGKAHVHVVMVGFGAFDVPKKTIFLYEKPTSEGHATTASNINPYLADAPDVVVLNRTRPINGALEIFYGSMMIDRDRRAGDDEGLILTAEHKRKLINECAGLRPYIRRIYGGDEFLNGAERWCLWLVDAPPELIRESPLLRERIEKVRTFRTNSHRPQTQELAKTPTLFGEIRQPSAKYLLIPKVSSMSRRYIPIGFVDPKIIASGSTLIVPGADSFHFGVLSSASHNSWMRYVAGRMKSDYQYSNGIVYNNFPWPSSPTPEQKANVEAAAQAVLKARADSPDSTLAALYDPLAMPPALVKAHLALDRAVDRCYRKEPFSSDRARVEFLFKLYEQLTAPLTAAAKSKRPRGRKETVYPAKPPDPPTPPHPGPTREQAEGDAAHYYSGKEEPPPYRTK